MCSRTVCPGLRGLCRTPEEMSKLTPSWSVRGVRHKASSLFVAIYFDPRAIGGEVSEPAFLLVSGTRILSMTFEALACVRPFSDLPPINKGWILGRVLLLMC